MPAYWSSSAAELIEAEPGAVVARLAHAQALAFRVNEAAQLRAWAETVALLRGALSGSAGAWRVLLEFPLLRLGRRADAVLVGAGVVVVLEMKVGAAQFGRADREQAEDFALDLQDFHAGGRGRAIVPVLVATEAAAPSGVRPLLLPGAVSAVLEANAATLAGLLAGLAAVPEGAGAVDAGAWEHAPYRPVPTIIEAARMLYGRHDVAAIAEARADVGSLRATTDAVRREVAAARAAGRPRVLFVTGIPGAGKTLCGLNACFGAEVETRATFLTGNPSLVHVLREALARDAIAQGGDARAARQRMEGVIQALPRFRDHYVGSGDVPAERVVVIDEAQRSWSRAHAVRKTLDRPVRLVDSEPGHLLDVMARHDEWAAIVCLVGGGQEIHDGEGGLAEWGAALASRPRWDVVAAPGVLGAADPRQRLPALVGLRLDASLHLDVPVRQVRGPLSARWVDAVLRGAVDEARGLAGGAPLLTRDLAAMRAHLRAASRGTRRCGLLASSGARRLRAEGLGVELAHMDAGAVARWFLDRWPDVRASDALEVVATEFSAQGLELDHAGLCWDADLVRVEGQAAWQVRAFRGTKWQVARDAEAVANRVNTYRVLLTRARYDTVVWVPRGDAGDATRAPAVLDGVAAFLERCGARALPEPVAEGAVAEEALLL
ncbi:MAG: DNA/RNA helicase domain-containing protein [Janthinobacterium lividum]